MKVIHIYLLKNTGKYTIFGFILAVSVLTLVSLFVISTGHQLNGSTIQHLLIISITLVPPVISYAFPLLAFIILIFSLAQMKEKKQILILKCIGLNTSQIYVSFLPIVFLIIASHLFLTLFLAPYASRISIASYKEINLGAILENAKTPNSFQEISHNIIFYFSKRHHKTLYNIFYHDSSVPMVITAKTGSINKNILNLENGVRFTYGLTPNVLIFKKASLDLKNFHKRPFYIKWNFDERYFTELIHKTRNKNKSLFYTQAIFMIAAPILTWNLITMVIICMIQLPESRQNLWPYICILFTFFTPCFFLFFIIYFYLQIHFLWYNILLLIISNFIPLMLIPIWKTII